MKESDLRKWHRTAGMILVIFIAVQVVTGVVLSLEDLIGEYWGGFIHELHYGSRYIGSIYRIILGIGLGWMIASGVMIYRNIRSRMKRQQGG